MRAGNACFQKLEVTKVAVSGQSRASSAPVTEANLCGAGRGGHPQGQVALEEGQPWFGRTRTVVLRAAGGAAARSCSGFARAHKRTEELAIYFRRERVDIDPFSDQKLARVIDSIHPGRLHIDLLKSRAGVRQPPSQKVAPKLRASVAVYRAWKISSSHS